MTIEPIEHRVRASDEAVATILRTPTPPRAATTTLVDLLTALDARRRYREKMVVGTYSGRLIATRGA